MCQLSLLCQSDKQKCVIVKNITQFSFHRETTTCKCYLSEAPVAFKLGQGHGKWYAENVKPQRVYQCLKFESSQLHGLQQRQKRPILTYLPQPAERPNKRGKKKKKNHHTHFI